MGAGATSLRAFAKLLGVSHPAVVKAVAAGRLSTLVVGKNGRGQPVITNAEAARMEWEANASRATKPAKGGGVSASLANVQRDVAIERKEKLRFENDLRRGRYVLLEDAKREAFEAERIIREGVLNLATRLAPELAAETDPHQVFVLLDRELRAALGRIADDLEQAS
jgi:hypothetical protein